MVMTLQVLVESWKVWGVYNSVEDPATEAYIKIAESIIGSKLPQILREVYLLFNGGWTLDLVFFPLEPDPLDDNDLGLTNANEQYIKAHWHIPKEIRLFANNGGEESFGIWLDDCNNPSFNHPIIEVGEFPDDPRCMGVAGTNLLSFLRGFSAYHLTEKEMDKDFRGEDILPIKKALDILLVPQSLRGEDFDESPYLDKISTGGDPRFSALRQWADPNLPDPYGDSYSQQYTIADLKKLFGET